MIAIVNYGLGNIRAFTNVLKNLNLPHLIASNSEDLNKASKILLPGVGAFDEAMTLLQKSGMREALDERVVHGKVPVLGICVGMQILAHSSEEGQLPGLGWIDGAVRKFDVSMFTRKPALPHMGWNTITPRSPNGLLQGLNNGSRFYFLHSYYFHCNNPGQEIAEAEYGIPFSCAVQSGNIYGVQFHPEKSHQNGIRVLKNFGAHC